MQMFDNGEFELEIRPSGESFTVQASALARYLGFYAAKDMLRTVPDKEKGWELSPTLGGEQRAWYVTEAGFYRVLGQRQVARIKDKKAANDVERFQDWVFGEVLPAIRRSGGYSSTRATYTEVQPRNPMDSSLVPNLYTWDEVSALIHQRTGIPLTVNELTRLLRSAGVLKQAGGPTAKYRHMFWFTGTSWNVHSHVMPQLTYKVFEQGREQQDFRFIQARLELEGVGQSTSLPAQRQAEMSRVLR